MADTQKYAEFAKSRITHDPLAQKITREEQQTVFLGKCMHFSDCLIQKKKIGTAGLPFRVDTSSTLIMTQ